MNKILNKNNSNSIEFISDIWINIKKFMISNTDYKMKFNAICCEVYQPYEFSDHRNKSFERQYMHIKVQKKELVKGMKDIVIRNMVVKAISKANKLYN